MELLIKYLIVNVAVAYFLEKSKIKMRVATVTHAIMFTVIFALLLIVQKDGFIATGVDYILGVEASSFLRLTLSAGMEGVVAPIMMIQLVTAILLFIAGFLFAARVVEYVKLRKHSPRSVKRPAKKPVFTYKHKPLVFVNKLYLKKCVMRC